MEIQSKGYDSALSLRELLSGVVPDKLSAALTVLLGAPARVVGGEGLGRGSAGGRGGPFAWPHGAVHNEFT